MIMQRLHIIVRGGVQRVGYRDRVQKVARKNSITGWVKNAPGYDVEIIAEGSEEDLARFRTGLQICEGPIQVESLEIIHMPYEGHFQYFEIIRGQPDEEMGERFDSVLHYLVRIDANIQRFVEIGERMLEKKDLMLGKQDIMIEKQDHMIDSQNTMISLQHDTIHTIQTMDQNIVHSLESRYVSIEHQLDEIRTALKKAGIMV